MRLVAMMTVAAGCWTDPAPVIPAAPPAPKSIYSFFDPATCEIDRIPETVCGPIDERWRTCGDRASRLEDFERKQLFVTPVASTRGFGYDEIATSTYARELADAGADHLGCCYSACTRLEVGLAVPPPRTRSLLKCLPVPPHGTSQPAAANHACPASVRLGDAMAPYTQGANGSCCYTIVNR